MKKNSIHILAFGDIAIDSKRYLFKDDALDSIQQFTSNADICIYNQEFPITNSNIRTELKRKFLCFKGHPQSVELAFRAGMNLACLANNHTFNYLEKGIDDTKEILVNKGISVVGAGKTLTEALEPKEYLINNIKLVVMNFAEKEYNCANQNHGGAAPIDIGLNSQLIKEYSSKNYKIIIVLHTGIDFCGYPSQRIVDMCRLYADLGATAILCHHSHMVSGYENYHNVPIFYGLGNFLTNIIVQDDCYFAGGCSIEISEDVTNFHPYYFRFNNIKGKLEIISANDFPLFFQRIEKVMHCLKDRELLNKHLLEEYLTISKEDYYYTLFTQSDYFIYRVFRKLHMTKWHYNIMKHRMKMNRKNSRKWNIIRCANHRDVLELIFNKYIDI